MLVPQVLTLTGGLRLVHIHDRHTRAGIFGICVRAGSANERTGQYGLAHFVEHTIFKGTRRRSAWHIINRMETVGGELNAYTTKDITVVYTQFPATALARAVELVADLTMNSQFPERELEKEREVVIDELQSYLDTPSEAIYDDFEDLAYAGCGYGHNILGTPLSVGNLTGADCRDFLRCYYRASNMVVFYCGPAGSQRVGAMVERCFGNLDTSPVQEQPPQLTTVAPFHSIRQLPVHQSHVVLGATVRTETGRQRLAASMLANITGGPGMNSLLNVELRERKGLVYTVEASNTFMGDNCAFTVYFGCDEVDRERCTNLCRNVFASLADGSALTQRRLQSVRKQYLGQLILAVENRENRILAAARATLLYGRPVPDDEVRAGIADMTAEELAQVAQCMAQCSSLSFVPDK